MRIRTKSLGGAGLVLVAALAVAAAPVMAHGRPVGTFTSTTVPIQDTSKGAGLNIHGFATLTLKGVNLTARITATGASPNLPHLMHIHGDIGMLNDCPNIFDDRDADLDNDGFLNNAEAEPAYGPILVTFTTTGSTSAAAALNLETAVMADSEGRIDYTRKFRIPGKVAVNLSDLHIVIHGADLDESGAYDGVVGSFPGVPLEAELPVSCGVIDRK
ncbi:hypothetical protein BH20CHL7_BH20CHL7_04680 [soil metagenome]